MVVVAVAEVVVAFVVAFVVASVVALVAVAFVVDTSVVSAALVLVQPVAVVPVVVPVVAVVDIFDIVLIFVVLHCKSYLVLDSLGLLVPGHFTCHPCIYGRLSSPLPDNAMTPPAVTHLNVVTGRSAGCAMAWSLALVERLVGSVPESVTNGLVCP